jgi:uncharacterized alpha-E superfamily protein
MLSRVADNIFWMSRYMERVKMLNKLLITNYNAMQDNAIHDNWKFILEAYGDKANLKNRRMYNIPTADVLQHLITEKNNPSSIANCIMLARENARSTQDHLTKEVWQSLNTCYHIVRKEEFQLQITHGDPIEAMDIIETKSYMYYGTLISTMDRGASYRFMRIGHYIERALQTLQILSIKLKEIDYKIYDENEVFSFRYLLYALSGYEFYGKTYRGELKTINIINFSLFNNSFTNSVFYCLNGIKVELNKLKDETTVQAYSEIEYEIGRILSNFVYNKPNWNDGRRLHIYLEELNMEISNISILFSKLYFGQL